jgi:hypothetical protein
VAQNLKSKQYIYLRDKMYKASTVYKRTNVRKEHFFTYYEKYQEKNYNKGKLMCVMAKIKKNNQHMNILTINPLHFSTFLQVEAMWHVQFYAQSLHFTMLSALIY